MIFTRFYTKHGVFEIKNEDTTLEAVHDFVRRLAIGEFSRVTGPTLQDSQITLTAGVLKDCVIEVLEISDETKH